MPVLNERLPGKGGISIIGGNINLATTVPAANHLRPIPAATETGLGADPTLRKLIAAHPALGTLPESERYTLPRWSRVRHINRKQVICRQDDPVISVILVLDGYLKLSTPDDDGDDIFLAIAGPGDCVGELAALQKRSHEADVTALTRCRLLMIDGWHFRQAFERHPEGLLAFLRVACDRLRRATEQLVDRNALTAPARLAKALLYLAGLAPSSRDGTVCPPLRLSQTELGEMTGVSREVVNKQLGVWRDAGWIVMSHGTLRSLDTAAISTILGGERHGEGEFRRAFA